MPVYSIGAHKVDPDKVLFEIERADAEESLAEFVRQSWHVIEPGQPYVHGWHVDFICEHLEAVTDGVVLPDGTIYNRILVNIPPGTMKSLLLNVFWPAWEWGPRNMPHMRYVCAAHKIENLSARDSRRMRELITSEWYQARWGDRVKLSRDQNEKLNFVNTAKGFRIATAITSLTGIRGDRVIIDDPHSVDSASSDTMRASEVETFLEAVPSRLTNPISSAIVVIMQRLHEEDVSGVILSKKLGYDHICLPMRFESWRAGMPTKLGICDPREEEGELLFPARFPEYVVDRDERVMGPYATAGQFQQRPEPRGGGVIKREWWQPWEEKSYPPMNFIVASLDTAYTTKTENDFSALTVWGIFTNGGIAEVTTKTVSRDNQWMDISTSIERAYSETSPKVMLMSAWQERMELHDLVEKVAQTCRRMRVDRLIIEDKAAGHSVAQELRRLYGHEDWAVQLINPGAIDKLARLYSVQHLFAEGMVYAPVKQWAEMVISQMATFPRGKHDDLVDTTSAALRHMRDLGLLVLPEEVRAEISRQMQHSGSPPPPLYPGSRS
jgi:predicted phage terminase large subunit-like protein